MRPGSERPSREKTVLKHEAEAAKQEALARRARAEADRKAAAADRLHIEAQESFEQAVGSRAEHRGRLSAADEIDPDVEDQVRRDRIS